MSEGHSRILAATGQFGVARPESEKGVACALTPFEDSGRATHQSSLCKLIQCAAMNDEFELRLAGSWPPEEWREVTVLVAVSGGPDSLALLRGLRALKIAGDGRLVAAHVNHQLRGSESDEDERFVREQCESLGLPCEVGKAPVAAIADEQGDGIEAAARQARYAFLTEAAHRVGARFVATGHTADDQAETILHRILRGTGIAGLAGSPRTRALSPATTLIRPMLTVRRAEVLAYLDRLGQPFREDRTNADRRFTRNRIRHELLPELARQYNPHVVEALVRLGKLARESQAALEPMIEDLMRTAVREGPQWRPCDGPPRSARRRRPHRARAVRHTLATPRLD